MVARNTNISTSHTNLDCLLGPSDFGNTNISTPHPWHTDLDYLLAQSGLGPSDFGNTHVTRISAHLTPGT